MARRNKVDYFELFVKISEYAQEYARELSSFFNEHFDADEGVGHVDGPETLLKLTELHQIEDASDDVTHTIANELLLEFVTPIEREDILTLATGLDDVVDELDEVLQHMYMYCVTTITQEVIDMMAIVTKAVAAVNAACQKFTYFKKSRSINDYLVKVQDAEDEGDSAYIQAVHDIFCRAKEHEGVRGVEAFGLAGVLASLEACCDACESVADTIVTVITKNS